jgi:GT2 family glycosyltransferase
MKLVTIIVNYNSGALTHTCIESIKAHGIPESSKVIVIDNNSSDDSVAFLRSDFPEVNVVANQKNVGLATAVNQALNMVESEYYLVLNPDIVVTTEAIKKLIEFMEKHPQTGVAGGKLISPNGQLQASCFRFYRISTVLFRRTWLGKTAWGKREVDRFLMRDFDHKSVRDVEWLMGSCLILRKDALKEVGGMDENFFLYFEDVDWCRRFWEKGWRVTYVPEAVFSHFHQRSSGASSLAGIITNWATREHIRSALKYFWKYRKRKIPQID